MDGDRWSRKKRNGTDAAKEAFERLDADGSGALISHHETFSTTIQSPYSSIKG